MLLPERQIILVHKDTFLIFLVFSGGYATYMFYKSCSVHFGISEAHEPTTFYELEYHQDAQMTCQQIQNTNPRDRFIELSAFFPAHETHVLGLTETYAVPIERNLLHKMFSSILPIIDVSKPNFVPPSPAAPSSPRRKLNLPVAKVAMNAKAKLKGKLQEDPHLPKIPDDCSVLQYSIEKNLVDIQNEDVSQDDINIPRVVSKSSLPTLAQVQQGGPLAVSAPTPSVLLSIPRGDTPQSYFASVRSAISTTVMSAISSVRTNRIGQRLGLNKETESNDSLTNSSQSTTSGVASNTFSTTSPNKAYPDIRRSMTEATLTGALLDSTGNLLVFSNFYKRNFVLRLPQGTGSALSFGICNQYVPGNPATFKKLTFRLRMVTFPVINYSNCCLFASEMILNFHHATLTTFLLTETAHLKYSFPSIIAADKNTIDSSIDYLYKQDFKVISKALLTESKDLIHRYYFFKVNPQDPEFLSIHDYSSATIFIQKQLTKRLATDFLVGCAALSVHSIPKIYLPDLSLLKDQEQEELKPAEPPKLTFGSSPSHPKNTDSPNSKCVDNDAETQDSNMSTVYSLSAQSYADFEMLKSNGIVLPTSVSTKPLTGLDALHACHKSLLSILTHQRSYFLGVFPMRPFTLSYTDPRKIMTTCDKKTLYTINILIEPADTATKESIGHTLRSLPSLNTSINPNISTYLILTFPKDKVLGTIVNSAYGDHNIAGVYVYNKHSEHITQTLERTFSTFSILDPVSKRRSLSNLQSLLPEYCALSFGSNTKQLIASTISSDSNSGMAHDDDDDNDTTVDADDVTNVVFSQFLHQDLYDHGLSPTVTGETRHLLELHLERLVENIYSLVYAKIYNSVISALNCNFLINFTGCSSVGKTELVDSFLGADGAACIQESSYTSLERVHAYLDGNFNHPFVIDHEDLLRELVKYRLKCVRDGCLFSLYEGNLSVYNPSVLDKAERSLVLHLHTNQATAHYRKYQQSLRANGNKTFINQIWPCYVWYRDNVLSAAKKYISILNYDTTQHKPEETYSYLMYLLGRIVDAHNQNTSKGSLV